MDYEYHKLKSQLAILKDVAETYPTSSIQNAIAQISARVKEMEKQGDLIFKSL